MQAVAIDPEIFERFIGRDIGFRQQHRIALAPLRHGADLAQQAISGRRIGDVDPVLRDQKGHGVHTKARNAQLQPEADDFEDFGLDIGIGNVEIRLEFEEAMEIPGTRLAAISPGRFLHAGKDHALVRIGGLLVGPDEIVAKLGRGIIDRGLEPGVLVRTMVHHQIHDHAQPALVASVDELDEVARRAVAWIDAIIVRDVIAMVTPRRRLERREPNGGDAQPLQIIEPAHRTAKVTDTIAISILKCIERQAVDDGVLVPQVRDHPSLPSSRRISPSSASSTGGSASRAPPARADSSTCCTFQPAGSSSGTVSAVRFSRTPIVAPR